MIKRNVAYSREMLEQMPTQQLDEMFQNELRKNPIDEGAVRMIMEVLGDREQDHPLEMNPEIGKAWDRYQAQATAPKKPEKDNKWLMKVASITVLVFALVATVPHEAEAAGFFERIARWTESIFELFVPGSAEAERPEYVFETDNPGLQEVYDAVTELGVTEPVVPMWLPEGYELVSCEVVETPVQAGIIAVFNNGLNEVVFTVDINEQMTPFRYEKNDDEVEILEFWGFNYYLLNNYDKYSIVWSRACVECVLTIDASYDIVCEIIKSINEVR